MDDGNKIEFVSSISKHLSKPAYLSVNNGINILFIKLLEVAPGRFELPSQPPKGWMLDHYTRGLWEKDVEADL